MVTTIMYRITKATDIVKDAQSPNFQLRNEALQDLLEVSSELRLRKFSYFDIIPL